MKSRFNYIVFALLLTGCAGQEENRLNVNKQIGVKRMLNDNNAALEARKFTNKPEPTRFDDFIEQAAKRYGVDETLIKAIIQVESDFRPEVVSKSNAVGLMQIKASTAGRDAYRMKGKSGQPTIRELKDPETRAC